MHLHATSVTFQARIGFQTSKALRRISCAGGLIQPYKTDEPSRFEALLAPIREVIFSRVRRGVRFALRVAKTSVPSHELPRLFRILLASAWPRCNSPVASSYVSFPIGYPRIPVAILYLFRGPTSLVWIRSRRYPSLLRLAAVGLLDASLLTPLFYTLIATKSRHPAPMSNGLWYHVICLLLSHFLRLVARGTDLA